MPCIYDDFGESDRKRREELDRLTRWLCYLCANLEGSDGEGVLRSDPELVAWWEKHKENDRLRREQDQEDQRREAVADGAMQKLTDEERRALGLIR